MSDRSLSKQNRRHPDVLFLVIDCLRADRISRFGYDRATTPFLDEIEARAFSNAIAPAPWTYPSVAAMLTGLFPHNHGAVPTSETRSWSPIGDLELSVLPADIETLPDILGDAGYRTWCRTGIKPVEMVVGERFDTVMCDHHARGDKLVDSLLSWWDSTVTSGDPRFAYVQFADLHGWDVTQSEDDRHLPEDEPFGELEYLPPADTVDWSDSAARSQYLEMFQRIYDTQLRRVDGLIQTVIEALQVRGDLDDTIVVITGDHGEAFGEHAAVEQGPLSFPHGEPYGLGHGRTLFNEVLNVPIFLHDGACVDVNDSRVSTIDIFPTVLHNVGIEPSPQLDAVPLKVADETRSILVSGVGHGHAQRAVYDGSYKLIEQVSHGEQLLYNIEADPNEQTALENPSASSRLSRQLADISRTKDGERVKVSDDVASRLEDLGYRN